VVVERSGYGDWSTLASRPSRQRRAFKAVPTNTASCGARLRHGGKRQRSVQVRSSNSERSDPLDAVVGVEFAGGDRAQS
jgi:hypothetical protein